MKDNIERLRTLCDQQEIACETDAPLREHCTFRVGGPADLLLRPGSEEGIAAALRGARELDVPLVVLGRGSNVLFADEGFRGAVLLLGKNFARLREGEHGLFCESGLSLKALCEAALERSLGGLEFAYGIPGTVGGAVYMNAGAYGGEMKDVLVRSRSLDARGTPGELEGEAQALGYRHSAYTNSDRVITGAWVRLTPGNRDDIKAKMSDYMQRRRDKQPLDLPSAGSTFRRPPGNYASALIDQCGLKGLRVGGACVSEKHAGFVVNDRGASARDILALMDQIKQEVHRQTGYELESEVRVIGME